MPTLIRWVLAGLIALFVFQPLSAQEDGSALPPPLPYKLLGELREYGKVFADKPRDIDLLQTRLKLELLSGLGGNFAFRTANFLTYDAPEKKLYWDLKEAYTGFYSTYFEAALGKQIISWGKARDFNPTDVVSPQNLTDLMEDKPLRKIGLFLLKADAKLVSIVLEGIIKPDFDSARIPMPGSRWAFYSLPAGLEALPGAQAPGRNVSDFERALRLSWAGPFIDASLCYFDGWDQEPTVRYSVNPVTGAALVSSRAYSRTRMIGADVSSTLGSADIWAEAAYFRTADTKGIDLFIKNPYFQYIIGTNYPAPGDIKATLQFFQEIIMETNSEAEEKSEEAINSKLGIGFPLEQSVILNLDRGFGPNETYRGQVAFIYDIKEEGSCFNPKFIFSPSASMTYELGAVLFAGQRELFFGRFRNNNEAYLKGSYAF